MNVRPSSRALRTILLSVAAAVAAVVPGSASTAPPAAEPGTPSLLVSGLAGGSGSTIGPGGDLYVAEPLAGRISRVDPATGDVTTFASGLPAQLVGLGGVMDIAFVGSTAYVVVTLVGPDVGGSDVVGIYRIDGPDSFTVIADIGAYSVSNPPSTQFDVPTGVQYALEPYRGGLLVTDGHHNRVLWVTLDGEITELIAFGNTVPTGLARRGDTIYMAEAGPTPHLPETGRVVSFDARSSAATEVAAGGRLLVDVELGRGNTLFALDQGLFPVGDPPGAPALPDTGRLLLVNADGTFTTLAGGLDLPTSLEVIGNVAYVVTLGGEIWTIDGIAGPPYGTSG